MYNEVDFLTLSQLIDYIESNIELSCDEFIYNEETYNELTY